VPFHHPTVFRMNQRDSIRCASRSQAVIPSIVLWNTHHIVSRKTPFPLTWKPELGMITARGAGHRSVAADFGRMKC
jgi:hypothetical protein